jgi:peptide deformylase
LRLFFPDVILVLGTNMATRTILRFPDPKLRQRSAEVAGVDDDLRQLVADMAETMAAAEGAGLAAIQVGAPVRLFIVDGHVAGGAEGSPVKVFINPEILEISDEAQTGDEGCLSFPNIFVPVKRGMRARVKAMDLDGNTFEAEGEALFARALQHETDHLNGRLLIDQVGPVKREIIKRKLRKDLEAEREAAAEREPARAAR